MDLIWELAAFIQEILVLTLWFVGILLLYDAGAYVRAKTKEVKHNHIETERWLEKFGL